MSDRRTRLGRQARLGLRRVETLAVLVALVPVAVAIVRRSGTRWIPIGDNALVELRSRDVFSLRHFPLLGTWSSASLSAGKDLNHPGPLLFDLLAVPVRLFGGATGVALGVGAINAAMIVGVAVVGHRVSGRTGSLLATAVAALLAYTLGSGMLTDPWNPHVLVLPAFCLLVLVWGVASGELWLLPWLVAVGSLCLQTHLGYAYLVPALCATALAGAAVVHRRRWRLDPACRDLDRPRIVRVARWSGVTLVVLWAQPFIEQLTSAGQGNLARIATSAGSDEPVVGFGLGAKIVASLVAVPPWWSRSSFVGTVVHTPYDADGVSVSPTGLPSAAATVIALGLLVALLVAAAVVAVRHRHRAATVAAAVALVALAVALGTLTVMPIGPLGLTPHQMRWIWSLGAFVLFAVALGASEWVSARRVVPVALAVIAVVSVFNLPAYVHLAGPDTFPEAIPVARAISEQVDDYQATGSVVLDTAGLRYLEPYSAVVMAALERAGVDFRVADESLLRQIGPARRADGDETVRLFIREGRDALTVPGGTTRIAFTSPLGAGEIAQLEAGEAAMVDEFAVMGIVISAAGETMIDAGAFGLTRAEIEAVALDAAGFVHGGLAAELVAAGALDLGDGVDEQFHATSDLRRRLGTTTVAVFAEPLA